VSAREEILDRVRAALAGVPEPPVVDRSYRRSAEPSQTEPFEAGPSRARLLELFADRVEEYRAVVERCLAADVDSRIAVAIDGVRCVVPPDLPWDVPGATADTGQSAAELDAIEAVVTAATVAIALTGTIVLDHAAGQGRRALSLVPDLHICVVRADQIVPGLPEAVAVLDPRRPQTWISGPSATSDIELNRVEGVHGPRRLHVIVAE
jgi:L-lactate dehydrogenase complex protein LldG